MKTLICDRLRRLIKLFTEKGKTFVALIVIEFDPAQFIKRAQTALNTPKTFAGSQLRKGHAEKLIIAEKGAHAVFALIAIHAFAESIF